jgi:hypothetical protein
VGRTVSLKLVYSFGKLTARPFEVPVEEVIISDRNLNQTLKEEPVIVSRLHPEILEHVMTLEEAAGVKELDASRQSWIVHVEEYNKKEAEIQLIWSVCRRKPHIIGDSSEGMLLFRESRQSSDVEVPRFRMVHDQRIGTLLRNKLELLRQLHADAPGLQQVEQYRMILKRRTGGIAEAVA